MSNTIIRTTTATLTEAKRPFHRYPMIDFYVESRKKRCSDATNRQCGERLNTIFDELTASYGVIIHDRTLEGLTGHVLQTWFNAFVDTRKPATINNYLSFLNPFLRWAFQIGYMPEDLSHLLRTMRIPTCDELPEWEQPKEKYLTHEQVRSLLDCVGTGTFALRNRAIIALLVYSGIRVSELCSLTIGSVMERPAGTLYCKRKGGRWCNVYMSKAVYPYLDAYLDTRTDKDDMSAPLFLSVRGKPLDRYAVYTAIRPVQEQLGLATGPHVLRHTYISEMEKLGGVTIARDLANHKSFHITNRYDHTTSQQKEDALKKLTW